MAAAMAATPRNDRVSSTDHQVTGPAGAPTVRVRVYRPTARTAPLRGILLVHRGGMITGAIESEEPARDAGGRVGAVVVSPDHRLAPENHLPGGARGSAATVLRWLTDGLSHARR